MAIIPKTAGALSVISSLNDIHNTAMIYSTQEFQKASSNETLAISIGNQKADYVSLKDAKRKNWVNSKQFFTGFPQTVASVKGYAKGVVEGVMRYWPKFALSALAILPKAKNNPNAKGLFKIFKTKGKEISYISAIALAAYEVYDFLKNGTELFERRNYLERK